MREKIAAFIVTLVLAVGICPTLAFAATTDGGSLQAGDAQITAQASKDLGNCTIKFTDKQHQGKATDTWQMYYVKGKNTSAKPAFNLYYGKTKVSKSKYTVTYKRYYWDGTKDKAVTKKVKASQLTPKGSPEDKMSCEYVIVVKAKKGSGYTGTNNKTMICVVNQYGIGRFTDMKLTKARSAWHYAQNGMNSNYYVIPAAKAKKTLNSLKLVNGKTTVPKKSYTVTYYKAKKNVVKNGMAIEKAKTGKKLRAMPTTSGSYVMVIKGKSPYYGKEYILFDIQDKMSKTAIAKVADQKYTGNAVTPKLTVTYKGKTLKQGSDYTVTYKNNVEAGTATATITGCNKVWTFEYDPAKEQAYRDGTANPVVEKNKQRFFTGTKSITFKIVK